MINSHCWFYCRCDGETGRCLFLYFFKDQQQSDVDSGALPSKNVSLSPRKGGGGEGGGRVRGVEGGVGCA